MWIIERHTSQLSVSCATLRRKTSEPVMEPWHFLAQTRTLQVWQLQGGFRPTRPQSQHPRPGCLGALLEML